MNFLIYIIEFGVIHLFTCSFALKSNDMDIMKIMDKYFSTARHPVKNPPALEAARQFLYDEMRSQGLETSLQEFETEIIMDYTRIPVRGANIIGIMKGERWYTEQDEILVFGANYDTDVQVNSVNDFGSGVIILLEVVKSFLPAVNRTCRIKNSVIFVAFDLQTRTYIEPEYHMTGSDYFQEFLKSLYPSQILGAYVIDSAINYNDSKKSQYLPSGFEQAFPDAYDLISNSDFRGDFLAVVTQNDEQHRLLTSLLQDTSKTYLPFTITKEKFYSNAYIEWQKQDHASFWEGSNESIPAVLITDTSKHLLRVFQVNTDFQGMFRGQALCSDVKCNVYELVSKKKLNMLRTTASSLLSIIDKCQCGKF